MRIVEYQHRNEGGGNSVVLDNATWEHGESVVIFSKRELRDELRLAIFSPEVACKERINAILDQLTKLG
jgi:hypothetical protein